MIKGFLAEKKAKILSAIISLSILGTCFSFSPVSAATTTFLDYTANNDNQFSVPCIVAHNNTSIVGFWGGILQPANTNDNSCYVIFKIAASSGTTFNNLTVTTVCRVLFGNMTYQAVDSVSGENPVTLTATKGADYTTDPSMSASYYSIDMSSAASGKSEVYLKVSIYGTPNTGWEFLYKLKAEGTDVGDPVPVQDFLNYTASYDNQLSATGIVAYNQMHVAGSYNGILLASVANSADAYAIFKISTAAGKTFNTLELEVIGRELFGSLSYYAVDDSSGTNPVALTDVKGSDYSSIPGSSYFSVDVTNQALGKSEVFIKVSFYGNNSSDWEYIRSLRAFGTSVGIPVVDVNLFNYRPNKKVQYDDPAIVAHNDVLITDMHEGALKANSVNSTTSSYVIFKIPAGQNMVFDRLSVNVIARTLFGSISYSVVDNAAGDNPVSVSPEITGAYSNPSYPGLTANNYQLGLTTLAKGKKEIYLKATILAAYGTSGSVDMDWTFIWNMEGVGGVSLAPTTLITATAGVGGSISDSGEQTAYIGYDKTYNITPDADYLIKDVLIDGTSTGVTDTYTFTNISASHTISAVFESTSGVSTTVVTISRSTVADYVGTASVVVVADGKQITGTQLIPTGAEIRVYTSGTLSALNTAAVSGDVDKNGNVDLYDLINVRSYLLNIGTLDNISVESAKLGYDKVDIRSLLTLKSLVIA